MGKKLASTLVFLLTFLFTMAQYAEDSIMFKRISDEIFMNGTAYSNLRILCKKIGPRLSGSAGAAKAVGLVLPALAGRFDGFAMRVPVINVNYCETSRTSCSHLNASAYSSTRFLASKTLSFSRQG
jgi:hypothetical protein